MAGALSDYLEDKIVRWLFRGEAFSPPATVYVALFTTAPGEAGGGVEVVGGGYTRQAVTTSPTASTGWAAPAAGTGLTNNINQIAFPTATADWGTIVAVAIYDAASGGNELFYGTLAASKVVSQGDTFRFNASDLAVSLD